MKVGILTFHCAHNYGAVLQCYALQETLKKMGCNVVVIDYRPNYLITPYKVFNFRRLLTKNIWLLFKRCVVESLTLPTKIIRSRNFNAFIKHFLNLSKKECISPNFDAYIMGSDQIWNSGITNGFDGCYFGYLPFPKEHRKYIAYAASMETEVLDENAQAYLQTALNNFDAISVREKHLAQLLQPLIDKPIKIVLDPTLLVDRHVWDKFLGTCPINGKYVLVYQVRENKETCRIAHEVAKQIGAVVIAISASVSWRRSEKTYQRESPQSFINWIKHASCVITTSFHGTAYSIIFDRPFYYVKWGTGDTRAESLLSATGLLNRILDKKLLPIFEDIDYIEVNRKLEKLRTESHDFLFAALNSK